MRKLDDSIQRMEQHSFRLGELEDEVLALIPRLNEIVYPTSFRMNVYLLSFACEYAAQHSIYRAEAERARQIEPTPSNERHLSQLIESEKNFKLVLLHRINIVKACLDNEPHFNYYSGEHYDPDHNRLV